MASRIDQIDTKGQKAAFGRPLVEDRGGGTVALTEPDAGFDVDDGTPKPPSPQRQVTTTPATPTTSRQQAVHHLRRHPHPPQHPPPRPGPPRGSSARHQILRLFLVPKRHIDAAGTWQTVVTKLAGVLVPCIETVLTTSVTVTLLPPENAYPWRRVAGVFNRVAAAAGVAPIAVPAARRCVARAPAYRRTSRPHGSYW